MTFSELVPNTWGATNWLLPIGLLILVRQGLASKEKEFGSEKSDPLRATFTDGIQLFKQLDVGRYRHEIAILGFRWFIAQSSKFMEYLLLFLSPFLIFG